MDINFDKELTLNILTSVQFISKYHLLRTFKRYYGQTPRQYLTSKRIEKSKEFLKSGKTAIETCWAVGFESPSTFSALFKEKIGLTPIEFQKEQLSRSQPRRNY